MNRKLAAFDIYVMSVELQDLIGSYIDKIYQVSKEDILIKIRNVKEKKKESIFIRNGAFLCRTEKNIVTPQKPSTFAMTLRKYVSNSTIQSIYQHEFDRIIFIECKKAQKTWKLVIELFSQGNIILLKQDDVIITPFSRERWAHRSIQSRQEYKPPPSQENPLLLSEQSFFEILEKSNADIVRTLASQMNLGGAYAEEVCAVANIDKNKSISLLTPEEKNRLFEAFSALTIRFEKHSFSPVLVKKDNTIIDVLPFPFASYPTDKLIFEETPQMIKGLQSAIVAHEGVVHAKNSAEDQKIQKLKHRRSQQEKAMQSYEQNIEKKQIEGELIYLHFKECDDILSKIKEGLQQKEKKELIKEINDHPLVKIFDPSENNLILSLSTLDDEIIDIPLNFRKSVAENAEHAYDLSKKFKQKLHGAEQAVQKTDQEIEKIKKQDKKEMINQIQFREKPKKTFWFESYRWCLSSNGNIIIGGKDAKSNDQVVKKHMQKDDRYAHADVHGAPSCVIKNRDINDDQVEITEQTLLEACIFSSCYSKAWKQFTEAQAYWVLPNQVSKTPQSGEYVPRGAFIIRGKRNFCNCELKLSIGKTLIEGIEKIMGGPQTAVEKWCSSFVRIKPGNSSKTTAAHTIADLLDASTDDIHKVLPPGGITIVSTKKKPKAEEIGE